MFIPFQRELQQAQRIFLMGAGGGFDIYSGIPLYLALKEAGKEVVLGNYAFSFLHHMICEEICPHAYRVTSQSKEQGYFPERTLAEWLRDRGEKDEVIAFQGTGVIPMKVAMSHIVQEYKIDTLILVDGGTDSLMIGNEAGLGTPTEDMASIVAGAGLALERKYLASIGFGIDHFHQVAHAQVLESIAQQMVEGGFKGVLSFPPSEPAVQGFLDLVTRSNETHKNHMSIVANSIADAFRGAYGDVHATPRTAGSRLYINPLMTLYWTFDLEHVADRLLYKDWIAQTMTKEQVLAQIASFRQAITPKGWEDIPL
ncbi:MAG: DUF1152 domain-containing protein [Bacteroidota bacterium]